MLLPLSLRCAHHVSTFSQEAFNYSQRYSLFFAKARFPSAGNNEAGDGGSGAKWARLSGGQRGSFSFLGRQIAASTKSRNERYFGNADMEVNIR